MLALIRGQEQKERMNMQVVKLTYRNRVYHRRSTYGGMDSEPDGSSIETCTLHVLIPSERDAHMAIDFCNHYAGNAHDKDYVFLSCEKVCECNAVIQKPLMKL